MSGAGDPPLVSIVVCTYDTGAADLRASLESALAQSHPRIEVVVVDDGSTDGSVEAVADLLADPRVVLIRFEGNRGKSAALNAALDRLSGDYYMVQDADDVSAPHRAAWQAAALTAEPELAAVFCGHAVIVNGRLLAPRLAAKSPAECRAEIDAILMPAHDPTAMYRVAKVADLRYATDLVLGEGFDYILRVGERDPIRVLGECLYGYRVRAGSLTQGDWRRAVLHNREVRRRALARRGLPSEPETPLMRPPGWRDNNLAAHFIESVLDLRRVGRRRDALRTGLACSRLHPLSPHYQKALVYSVAPRWLLGRLRRTARAREAAAA